MVGSLPISSESRVFTKGRGAEERTSRERFGASGGGGWQPPAVQSAIGPEVRLMSEGDYEIATRVSVPPAWIAATWSAVDDALAHEVRQETAQRELIARLHTRIGELKRAGAEEGLPWSSESENDFWAFVLLWPRLREPGLVLMDNGNLRAEWRNVAKEQVALEFRGYRQVYFVLFARRAEGPPIARSAGEDSIVRICEKIRGDNLTGLLSGEG